MNTKYYSCYAAVFLMAATTLAVGGEGTNVVRRSCCQTLESSVAALPNKSIYQLDSVWKNDDGKEVSLNSLKGRPQVVAMFFANCQFTCPMVVFQMKQLQAALPAGLRTNVGFTLVSFDSKNDTPAVLKNYRAQHELPSDTWTLLNGNPDAVLELADVLGVKFKQTAGGQFAHSNLITLLNAQGEIVYQQAGLGEDNREIIRQIEKLGAH